ncbi:putative dehydrogenase [Silvibacterium bohemicum]|uniref:Putative dehydrogenase n=1 Tax=Silvibacterium bohemicum TaxID=1577686 RepID=A0A841K199_9BACT|nr:Gfo/Idh/MocA family oxidoreductase [Silvibacterium bohemicum]MBB6145729.1 putative dehydrogenase [Silvibacterium bohemicum]
MSSPTVNVVVCGAGAFGRNHLRIYRELQQGGQPVRLSAIVDSDASRLAALKEEFSVPAFATLAGCLEARGNGEIKIDAASVCVPTSEHEAVAAPLLEAGIDLLVEKPIAATKEQAAKLTALAQQHGRILQVGHLERFNPAVVAIRPWLNRPMFFEAHRLSIFTPRALDVDVVLDLMIHDLDIVLSITQSPVRDLHAVGLPILSGKVDIANVRIEFESGCVANFTASRVSTEKVRKLRFFQPHQYISIDYARRDLLVIDVDPKAAPNPSGLPAGLAFHKPVVQPGEPLLLEIESFLESVRTRETPRVSAQDGQAALALALDINAAIAEHAQRAGLDRF